MDRRTPGYLLREELQRDKLRGRAGLRAWGFEERIKRDKGSKLARDCLEEIKKRAEKGKHLSSWEKERYTFFEERGLRITVLEEEERRKDLKADLIEIEKRLQKEERWERIENLTFNKWYKLVKGIGFPGYLKKKDGERVNGKGWVRYKLSEEMRESRY